MKEQTCCFTGHRKIPREQYDTIVARLEEEITKLIESGVKYFGAGGALGFDTMAALTVLRLKSKYPQIRLVLVLPCPEQADKWSDKDRQQYEEIKKQADKVVYTFDHYTNACMHIRNRHLVDNSSYCICYLTEESGGTFSTVDYAQKQTITITNLAKR